MQPGWGFLSNPATSGEMSTTARYAGWVLLDECVALSPGISFAESPGTSSPAESSESWFTETWLQDASSAECYACLFV